MNESQTNIDIWTETGRSVDKLYKEYRAEAEK